ncbi:NTP transferase domain-containing protein, partial [Micromonospora sp. ATA32]|nr:NTP transferase domain-containing protein [Micromonospora sp. ATA32]
VRLLLAGGCAPVHVVVGAGADALPELSGAVPVVNRRWRDGLGASLRLGLTSLPGNACAVVVVLVDQPSLDPTASAGSGRRTPPGRRSRLPPMPGGPGIRCCWTGRPGRRSPGTRRVTGAPGTFCARGPTWSPWCRATTQARRRTWTPQPT